MKRVSPFSFCMILGLALFIVGTNFASAKHDLQKEDPHQWKIHDPDRPMPLVVTPGAAGPPVPPPSDAILLFVGADLSLWTNSKGGPAAWKVERDYVEVVKKAGSIQTKHSFGDCQLHIEWMAPLPAEGESQDRGNSGVYLMKLYEVQVLDCFNNKTYADGMTAAIYGQYPPLVNACRPPGEWQTYDIIFTRPRFDPEGNLKQPAFMTVFHNNILVHDHVELTGPTEPSDRRTPYKPHAERLPLSLQDHGNPVRYRNIWIRDLEKNNEM